MLRTLTLLLAVSLLGCADHREPVSSRNEQEVKDGGGGNHAHRNKAHSYFASLKNAEDASQEHEVSVAFAAWLNEHNYKLQVDVEDGVHTLACPHFPPVTPWIEYTFRDPDNLELLPQESHAVPGD